jgi:hypothetical protein
MVVLLHWLWRVNASSTSSLLSRTPCWQVCLLVQLLAEDLHIPVLTFIVYGLKDGKLPHERELVEGTVVLLPLRSQFKAIADRNGCAEDPD